MNFFLSFSYFCTRERKKIMIITIARQCGCGALHVGEILAKRYGVPLYTRRSLMEMAQRKGMQEEMDSFFEERPVDDLMEAITDYAYERRAVMDKFRKAFSGMIGNQDCIVIGRCGNYIFKDRKDLVSVFLHGDIDLRISNIEREEHLGRREAEEFVRRTDDCRVSYHKFYTGLTWGNAPDYDICIDLCSIGAEKTAKMIEEYIGLL